MLSFYDLALYLGSLLAQVHYSLPKYHCYLWIFFQSWALYTNLLCSFCQFTYMKYKYPCMETLYLVIIKLVWQENYFISNCISDLFVLSLSTWTLISRSCFPLDMRWLLFGLCQRLFLKIREVGKTGEKNANISFWIKYSPVIRRGGWRDSSLSEILVKDLNSKLHASLYLYLGKQA